MKRQVVLMYKGIYWLCLCWLFGHEWEVSIYGPNEIRDWQKEGYPYSSASDTDWSNGCYVSICKYCRHVERGPLVERIK